MDAFKVLEIQEMITFCQTIQISLRGTFQNIVPRLRQSVIEVWYHSNCSNRGKGCYNTRLTDEGGCCIWYNEPQLKSDVEEHLDITIHTVEPDMKIPVNMFDGKISYGQKMKATGSIYQGHVHFLVPAVAELVQLEKRAQSSFNDLKFKKKFAAR